MAISLNNHESRINSINTNISSLGTRITNLEKNPKKTHIVTSLSWSGNSQQTTFTFTNSGGWTGGVVYSGSGRGYDGNYRLYHDNWKLSFSGSTINLTRSFSAKLFEFTANVIMYK